MTGPVGTGAHAHGPTRPTAPPRHARPGAAGRSTGAAAPYRHDLDGLRALAVVLVAVYHVWVHRVSGGVDVFLMLSGFFVAGGLLRSFARGTPVRLRTYLPRLARRLLPALVLVLAAVLVASAVLLPRTRWTGVSGDVLGSLLYAENWRLAAAEQAYGAADVGQSPLQHVWSLSVQGQLFVGLPILLLLVWWSAGRAAVARRLMIVHATVLAAAVASFAYAVVAVRADQATAYYDTFARAWEYLAGALLALLVTRVRLPGAWGLVAGWAGLALVVASGVLVDGAALFPGPATLVPLAGAALVVVAGAPGPRGIAVADAWSVSRLLARSPVARAGGYAYAFYLWHWPVLVFTIVLRDRPVGWLAGVAVLGLAAVLAVLTKHLVEDVLRRDPRDPRDVRDATPARPPRWALRPLVVAVTATVAIAPLVWNAHVLSIQRSYQSTVQDADVAAYPGALSVLEPGAYAAATADPVPAVETVAEDTSRVVPDGCMTGNRESDVKRCSYGPEDATTVVALVGASHSEHWFAALEPIAERRGFRVVPVLKAGCLFLDPEDSVGDGECATWQREAMDYVLSVEPDVVITTSTRPTMSDGSRETVPDEYVRAWERLAQDDIPVVAIRDNPWLPFWMPECAAVHGSDSDECAVAWEDVLDDVDPSLDAVQELWNTTILDFNDVLCPDRVCRPVQGNRFVYRDDNHLTATYAVTLSPVFDERFGVATGWW
ncbi:acyltransferase family protein [Cellulosimicrobium sp. SH8]|uniref:acyltransferase family protein n=1 Tax=Cellulosimicrobium sp. SH8 TaxID=2952936 RepID=UPI0021F27EB3|nr:acyltransferase family protein [Cellulosimicrobium sp. SH8]